MRIAPIQHLFAGSQLSELLSAAASRASDRLAAWPPDDLLSTAEADISDQLIELATIEPPSIARDKAWLEPAVEVSVTAEKFGRYFHADATRFTLVIPVAGDPSLFDMTASRFPRDTILGEIDKLASTLRLYCHNPDNANHARRYLDGRLDEVEQRLELMRADMQAHNHHMARQLPAAVAQRRAKLLRDRDLQASIGYPIMKRPDANSYSVPLKRRQITLGSPARPSGSGRPNAYVPEPAIDDADYEAVLAVLRNARNALERNPSMSAKLTEPQVRDLLLVSLNAQFEGKAAGEVFNGEGKSDILVREGDRNVFIGECKIYDPNHAKQGVDFLVTGALDQLLNRYLTWRDTKAALLLFIRDANVSNAVGKALAAIRSHSNHLRPGKISTEERYDFVMHATGDKNREIRLAFLPFLIAAKSEKATAS